MPARTATAPGFLIHSPFVVAFFAVRAIQVRTIQVRTIGPLLFQLHESSAYYETVVQYPGFSLFLSVLRSASAGFTAQSSVEGLVSFYFDAVSIRIPVNRRHSNEFPYGGSLKL